VYDGAVFEIKKEIPTKEAVMTEPRTIRQQIEQNWEQIQSSSETKKAFGKLGKDTFGEEAPKCRECLTTYLNFESYKNSLQLLKTRQSRLHRDTEALFAERFEQALKAYRSFVSSADNIAKSFAASGIENVVSHNAKKLFWQLPHNQHYPHLAEMLRTMGVGESEILHYSTVLKTKDWDILHLQGANGTFAGLVRVASEQVPTLEKMLSAVKQHGLPVIEGGGGSALPAIIGIVVIVVIGIVCVASGACVFLG
jgi:hypothetical protein